MRLFAPLSLIFVFLGACQNNKPIDRFEGMLIYETTDPMLDNVPVDSGKFIKYFVKGDSIRVESYTSMGKQVHIKDLSSKSGVLIFVFAGRKVGLIQDWSLDTVQRGFSWSDDDESKKIANIKSKSGFVSGSFLDKEVKMFYSDRYPSKIINIYDGIIPGLPTEYMLVVQQIPVYYSLRKLEERKISDELFKIPNDCLLLTMDEFSELLSNENLYQ